MTTTNEMTREQIVEEIYHLHSGKLMTERERAEKVADWHLAKLTDLRERLAEEAKRFVQSHSLNPFGSQMHAHLLQVPLCPAKVPTWCEHISPCSYGWFVDEKHTRNWKSCVGDVEVPNNWEACPLCGKPRPEAMT